MEGSRILTVQWSPDSQGISYILEADSGMQIWRSQVDGSRREQLTHTQGALVELWEADFADSYKAYVLSPDGANIVYAVYGARGDLCPQKVEGGLVYEGQDISVFQGTSDCPVAIELWKHDVAQGSEEKIWTGPTVERRPSSSPPEFKWSPDGKTVAVSYQTGVTGPTSLALLDPFKATSKVLLAGLGSALDLDWTERESLRFYSEGILVPGKPRAQYAWYKFRLSDANLEKYPGEPAWVVGPSTETVAKIMAAVKKENGDLLTGCSVDLRGTWAACVREAPMIPPDVVSIELHDGLPRGNPRLLTKLNPQYDSIELGDVSKLTWPNRWGEGSAGLVLPVGYVPGRKYPLLVMLYNLYSGRHFISSVPALPNYPAQTFAGKGYAVLLMNVPSGAFTYPPGNFKEAKSAEVDGMVDDIRAAVELLSRRGVVNTTRMGIMGWSYGAFWTDYIVTHFPNWFQVAASGEGDNHNPSLYWQGGAEWREQERTFYGGGPYGKYYDRWKQIAPVLNVERLSVPLLMEYSGAYMNGIEMYRAIVEQGGQAELVIYPDDDHVFNKPLNRYNSMARHFDWFNFWLLGEEDPSPAKREQYDRWQQMRKALSSRHD